MLENTKSTNRLLAALPVKEYQNLLPKLEEVPLPFAETIYNPGNTISHIYFPNSGIISLLSSVGDRLLEVGIVGSEGFVGLPVFLGIKTSNNRALVQGEGVAMRIKTEDFLALCHNGGTMPSLLQRFTHSLLTQISQSAVCNSYHQIEQRLARWLLMTADRMQSDVLQITQQFLSNMLGVRREAVTLSARKFQRQELISYSRGKISILNRAGLEAVACRCYFIIKDELKIY